MFAELIRRFFRKPNYIILFNNYTYRKLHCNLLKNLIVFIIHSDVDLMNGMSEPNLFFMNW